MQHIMVVDDDRTYTKMLRFLLEGEGYTVTTLESAVSALESLDHTAYDLILLDIVMPAMDGLDLCRRIRATSQVPILFLTVRSDVADKVRGLHAGADDYLSKPFDPDEVLTRIWALLRRTDQRAQGDDQLTHTDLTLDMTTHTVTLHRIGTIVHLTPTEARLLRILLKNAGHSMMRDTLVIKVWGYDYEYLSNQLDVYIARLRTKIEEDPSDLKLIQTARGFGYRFAPAKAPPTAAPRRD